MTQSGSNKKVANKLVAASCAAVLAVYAAGYARTQSAANRLAAQVATERRAARPAAQPSTFPFTNVPTAPRVPPGVFAVVESASSRPTVDAKSKLNADREQTRVPTTADVPGGAPEPAPLAVASPVIEQVAPVIEHSAEIATAPLPALPAAAEPAKPVWKDGTYTGWGYSRHGNIEAAVVIESGRIASATISQCRTRYSCSVIENLPPQVAQRQSPEVDYVSGATQSADAFFGAVVEALSKAK
ncbi:MAG TPA: FMN-binding protein [Bryobacteraceae bacterium]|jgi:uncharacterized protein with FMN-binding domain